MKETKKIIALLTAMMVTVCSFAAFAADETTEEAAAEVTATETVEATEEEATEEVAEEEATEEVAEEEATEEETTEEATEEEATEETTEVVTEEAVDYSQFDGEGIEVVLDNAKIEFDVLPELVNDRTMVPVRAIFEALGAVVDWENETQTITAAKGDVVIMMQIDNTKMFVNGEEVELDAAPFLKDDSRTLVPLRAISESFGCTVDYIEATETVVIVSAVEEVVEEEVVEEEAVEEEATEEEAATEEATEEVTE